VCNDNSKVVLSQVLYLLDLSQ